MMQAEIITRFLESVGQKADVDLYLKLFRSQKKESFAVICPSARIVKTALDALHFDLRILNGLGLTPVVLLGVFEPRDADKQAATVQEWLLEDDVKAQTLPVTPPLSPAMIEVVRETTHMNTIPLVSLEGARDATLETRFAMLGALVATLESRKTIFLTTRAGLERAGSPPIPGVNLSTDYERLMTGNVLTRAHASLLRHSKALLDQTPHRMTTTVVNPLQLLRELFTVSGAGTMIRKGSRVERYDTLAPPVDRERLRALIESAFGRALQPGVLDHPIARAYIEENYLGAALMTSTPVGIYLSKFAVDRQAQGEGIGGDLWNVMTRDYPGFFWRTRATNPINSWYLKNCDGVARLDPWNVYWRGLTVAQLEPAIRYALAATVDFAS